MSNMVTKDSRYKFRSIQNYFLLSILFDSCKKLKNILLIAFLVSLSIEIAQLSVSLGSCDIDDIILNVLGAVIGFAGYKALKSIMK